MNRAEKETTIELSITGNKFEVFFIRVTEWEEDKNYGADADGRGGISMAVVLSDEAVDAQILHEGQWKPLLELEDDMRLEVEDAVEKWIEANDPELE